MFCFVFAFLMSQVVLKSEPLQVELAVSSEEQVLGLMNHAYLPEGHGMLFVYEEPKTLVFAMKKTKIPLSIGFFDATGRLLQIEHMHVVKDFSAQAPLYVSKRPAQYALEVPMGWFERHGILPGDQLEWKR